MPTDVQKLVEKVYLRVVPMLSAERASLYRFEIESMVDDALNILGDRVAESPDFMLLQKTFTVALTSGAGSFADDSVIPRTIPRQGNVTATGTSYSLQFLPSIQDLELGGRPQGFLYYTIRGDTQGGAIYVYDYAGSPTSVGSCVIRANYYPKQSAGALTAVPTELQDELVEILVNMCKEKLGVAPDAVQATPAN